MNDTDKNQEFDDDDDYDYDEIDYQEPKRKVRKFKERRAQ